MKEFSKKLNKKKFKYGGYAIAMTAGIVAVIVLLNLLLIYLDTNYNLSIDLTANRVYSLTKQTEHILDELDTDIYIYTLYTKDYEDAAVDALLNRYKSMSKYIHVDNINMTQSPGKVAFYENEKDISLSVNGLIVSTSADTTDPKQSFKILDGYDMYSYDAETESYSMFTGEDAITGSIRYVLNPNIPKVWFLKGHGVSSTQWSEMSSYLENENYDTGSISLVTESENLQKGDILIVLSPTTDLSNDEREVLLDFALDGGKIMFLFSPGLEKDLPNFMLILSHFNISMKDGVVIEDITGSHYYYDQTYLVPIYLSHAITSPMKSQSYPLMVPRAGALDIGPEQNGITVEKLIESSEDSYLEPFDGDMDGIKNEGAQEGPFTLAVAVTKNATEETDESQIIIASNAVMFQQISQINFIGNYEMYLNSISWLNPVEDDFYIRGKSLKTSVLYFESESQKKFLTILVSVIIPLIIFAAALVVYLKRRHL